MLVELLNNTEYKKIKVICDGKDFFIEQNKTVTVDVGERFNLKVFTEEKNRTMLNWLFLLIDGFVDENSIVNIVYCDAEFEITASDMENVKKISFETLEKRNDSELILLYSIYPNSENVEVLGTRYIPTNTDKQQRKSRRYLLFLASLLWVVIPLVINMIYYGSFWNVIVIAFLLIFFTVPSFKKLRYLKSSFSDEHIISSLKNKEAEYRTNGGKPVYVAPSGFIEKAVHKILDKIFKGR